MAAGRIAKPRIKAVISLEFTKTLLLDTTMAQQDFANSTGQVVIDQDGKIPP
jgi:hypothetical protein